MQQDVSAYYDQTQNHYQRWWQLDKGMSLHYGLWHPETKNFVEALGNTNQYMATLADIKTGEKILDAGCGVGGAAIFLAQEYSAKVTGVSLSERQIATAQLNALKHKVSNLVDFQLSDYTETNFSQGSFDLIWACESSSSAPDKAKMLREWQRLLKPGGKLVLLDFFKVPKVVQPEEDLLRQWCDLWAMSPLITLDELSTLLRENDFSLEQEENLSLKIEPTIKWMYKSYLLGRFPARLYNLIFGARKYSRNHYKSGLVQYKTYKQGLWQYHAILAQKN